MTFDGPSRHVTMANKLGAKLRLPSPNPTFQHPVSADKSVQILLDVCHMLKLVRNILSDVGITVDSAGNKVLWQYVEYDAEGLRLGNKLKISHIRWRQEKIKVRPSVQTFSSSVADAIDYCTSVLKLKEFEGSADTVKFIR